MLPSSRDSSGTENTEGCPPGLGSHISTSASGCSFRTAISSGRSGSGAGFSSRRASSTTCPAGPSEPDSVSSECNDPLRTNLNAYHGMVVFDALILAGHFAKVRHLSDCCRSDGKVELHRWETSRPEGEDSMVVVKRVLASRVNENRDKEACEHVVYQTRISRDAEDTLTEIGIYCYLARQADMPQYLLKMHTVFESGSDVWLVLEHADGGDLFGIVQANGGVEAKQLLRWMWELLQAVQYLHKRSIGHRDISIENVLLRQGAVRLMDFGQAVATHSMDGTPLRYFRAGGKPYYTPAECYIPSDPFVQISMSAEASEGDVVFVRTDNDFLCEVRLASSSVVGQQTMAEPWGYAAAPVDIYACGICLFIMATGMPPYCQAKLVDPHFAWLRNNGVAALLQAWGKPLHGETLALLEATLQQDPVARPTVEACLQEPCFASFRSEVVPTHTPSALASSKPAVEVAEPIAAYQAPALSASSTEWFAGALIGGAVGGEWSEAVCSTGLFGDYYVAAGAYRSDDYGHPCPPDARGTRSSGFATHMGDLYGSPQNPMGDRYCLPGDPYRNTFVELCTGEPLLSISKAEAGESALLPTLPSLERFIADSEMGQQPSEVSDVFMMEKTTLALPEGAVASDVGNRLLDFLAALEGTSVTKVNRSKFSIQVDIDIEIGVCSLKVRLLTLPGAGCAGSSAAAPQLVAEFQLCTGDSPVLHWAFSKASDYLDAPFYEQHPFPFMPNDVAPTAASQHRVGSVGDASKVSKVLRSESGIDHVQALRARGDTAVASVVPVLPPAQYKLPTGSRSSSKKAVGSAAHATPRGADGCSTYGDGSRPSSSSSAPLASIQPLSCKPTAPQGAKSAQMMQPQGAGTAASPGVKGLLQRRRCATSSLTPVLPEGPMSTHRRPLLGVVRRLLPTSEVKRLPVVR